LEVAWVLLKIVGAVELGGVDENRRDHVAGFFACQTHQRAMPVMQRAHGRNQADGQATLAGRRDMLACFGDLM